MSPLDTSGLWPRTWRFWTRPEPAVSARCAGLRGLPCPFRTRPGS